MIQILSFPRSGQELIQSILRYFYNLKSKKFTYCHFYESLRHGDYDCFCEKKECINNCSFQKNHDLALNPFSCKYHKHLCSNIEIKGNKKIILFRSDIVTSLESFFRFEKNITKPNYEDKNIKKMFKRECNNGYCNKQYYKNFIEKWVDNEYDNIYKIEYYEFLKNYDNIIHDLLNNFLDIEIELNEIKKHTSIFNIQLKNKLSEKEYNILSNLI